MTVQREALSSGQAAALERYAERCVRTVVAEVARQRGARLAEVVGPVRSSAVTPAADEAIARAYRLLSSKEPLGRIFKRSQESIDSALRRWWAQ